MKFVLIAIIISLSFLIAGVAGMTADFSADMTTGPAPLTVSFTDLSSDIPTGWAWFFGDENYDASWVQVSTDSGWTARSTPRSVLIPDGSIVLMGGYAYGEGFKNDTWRSTDDGATWTLINASSGWLAREEHSSVAMPDGSIVLMGGIHSDPTFTIMNDTWRSTDNGATWTLMNGSSGWSGRYGLTSVAMPDGSIVLMGGLAHYDGFFKNDTWRSTNNGATWTLMNASSGWLGREGHNSVVMPDGSIILMGGNADGQGMNDVWRSIDNGATWTQMNASPGWWPRSNPSSVAMPDGSIILMGGITPGHSMYNDVWRSADNGATWTQLSATTDWTTRECQSSLAIPNGSIVLIGGQSHSGLLNDTWRFNPVGSLAQNPSHTYTTPGVYQVALQVYNTGGYTNTQKIGYITVTAPPTADFIGTPTTGTPPLAVQFNDTSTSFGLKTWNWSFGDTTWFNTSTSSLRNVSHTYTSSGVYTVAFTVSNESGSNTSTNIDYITVSIPPTTVPPPSPTTAPTITSSESNSDDSMPVTTIVTMIETTIPTPETNTVNVGGSSAVYRVVITGTGISDLLVTGIVKSRPDNGPYPPGIVYQYIDLVPVRFKTINSAEIFFSVPRSWLDEHRIAPKNIILYHLTGNGWVALPTKFLETKDGNLFHSATSPGFSLFAIAGTADNETPVTVSTSQMTFGGLEQEQTPVQTANVPVTTQTTIPLATNVIPSAPSPLLNIVLFIAAIGILIGGGFMVRWWWIMRKNPALFRKYD